jgi:hypothetical protein
MREVEIFMSWEIDLICSCCGHELASWNYTNNMNAAIRASGAKWSMPELIEMKAADLAENIDIFTSAYDAGPEEYDAYNLEQDWGSAMGVARLLAEMAETCRKYPKALVTASF